MTVCIFKHVPMEMHGHLMTPTPMARLEEVPLAMFEELRSGDLLFIDSSHVVRPFSDVILELVHILPRLRSGVVVHVHDIKLPFYQRKFLEEQSRHYAEQDMLACFL